MSSVNRDNFSNITYDSSGQIHVPDQVNIPIIIGDGIGHDVSTTMMKVVSQSVKKAYSGNRDIHWVEIDAGESSFEKNGQWLPEQTLTAIREHHVAIKGPLTTPVGGGIRSLNVALRQKVGLICLSKTS